MKRSPVKYGFPLEWPEGRKRTVNKKTGAYTTTWKDAECDFEKLAAANNLQNITIISNLIDFRLQGTDSAVSITFVNVGRKYELYCDKFYKASHNLIYLVRYLEHWVKMMGMAVVVVEKSTSIPLLPDPEPSEVYLNQIK